MSVALSSDVSSVFEDFPDILHQVRALILDLADQLDVGPLTETLKWGQPAFLTEVTKAGSTVRLGLKDGQPAVFFTCHTGLVEDFRADFPELTYFGNRGIALTDGMDRDALAICLTRALTYQRAKREARA